MKRLLKFRFFLLLTFFVFSFFSFIKTQNIIAAPATEFKDQLSSAQLSYYATLGTGNVSGNSIIYINTSGTSFSTNNYNLEVGDTLAIGLGTTTIFTVKGLSDTNAISLSAPIGTSHTAGSPVIVPRYSVHNVSFKPQSSIAAGKWQVLIKATDITSEHSNKIPDIDGFDLGTLIPGAVTCPWGASASIGTTSLSGKNYHTITCTLGAGVTNPLNITGIITIGNTSNMLINPAPASGHTVGQANANADTYSVILRHLDSANNLITEDTTSGKIALTESVRITVTVDPTITFSVGNNGVTTTGTIICGSPLGPGAPNTTGGSVDFGSLNLSSFNNLAQFIQCTTNAPNGYVVQVFESSQLTMIGGNTTIPDTTCPSNNCTITSAANWDNGNASGFGYSLQVGTTSTGATLGITTLGHYKPFGVGYANAQPIMSRPNTPAAIDSAYIGYRVAVSTSQPAGTYQNEINFIATATF